MEYIVTYSIEVSAETPKEAALVVEDCMRNGHYRPLLVVTDSNGKLTEIDLEGSELSLDNLEEK